MFFIKLVFWLGVTKYSITLPVHAGSAISRHSHVPRRSSRKPICSLRESMRSSCWKEWDSKVVFSEKPSSKDSGKTLVNGASTSCSFWMGGGQNERQAPPTAALGCPFLGYLLQELHSGLQALHLVRHVLQQAYPSACRNQANAFVKTLRGLSVNLTRGHQKQTGPPKSPSAEVSSPLFSATLQ